ncbi:MAG: TonB-dependent receptor plug domain-containing protein [Acidobacteria bacterium]|nr:TonB-dependent receptor plug domain-containing protein [Acidobacteriota bacterium]
MRVLRLLLTILAATALYAEGFVRGVVLDPDDRPVEGARVRILAPSGSALAEGRTSSEGAFEIAARARGTYSIVADHRGFARLQRAVDLPSAGVLELRLALAGVESEITVTAARGLVGLSEAAEAMVEARDREGFLARPMTTVGHAVEASPGILLQQTSAGQVSPFLRGLTGYQVLNLVDGIRFNNSTFRSGPNQYLAFFEPSQVQRIETALGPSSSQYGSDSLGGTIQVITREAPFGLSQRVEAHGDWSVFGATADASAGSDAHLSLGTARWSWLGGASGRRHSDLRAGRGADSRHVFRRFFGWSGAEIGRLQDTGFSQWGLNTRFALRPRPNEILSLWYQQSGQADSRNYKDLWGGLGGLQSALEPQNLHFAYARYERLNLGRLDTLSGTFSANVQGDGSRRQSLRQVRTEITCRCHELNSQRYVSNVAPRRHSRQQKGGHDQQRQVVHGNIGIAQRIDDYQQRDHGCQCVS